MWMRLLLAVPILFMTNMQHVPFETGIPGLNIANIVFVMVAGALVIGGRKYRPLEGRGQLTIPLLLLFGALTFGFLMAQATAPADPMLDITYLKNMVFYPLLYFLYRRCGQDMKGTRQLIILVMVVAAIAGVEAVREGMDYGFGAYSETRRAAGPFGNDYGSSNRAGVFYAMFLPMFVAMILFFRKQKLWQMAAIGGAAILIVAIMVTYSRQSYLIALVGIALLLLRRNLVLAAVIGALMLPAIGFLPQGVTQRVAETEQKDAVGSEKLDVSTASRFEIWDGAIQMWGQHPLGVGLNRFKGTIGNYVPRYAGFDAHNMYVLMLAECGVFGIGALLYLLLRLLLMGVRFTRAAPQSDAEAKALSLGFILVVISAALGNVYGSPFFEGTVMSNFWILCGLMEHYTALKRRSAVARAGTAMQAATHSEAAAASIAERFPMAARIAPGRHAAPPRE